MRTKSSRKISSRFALCRKPLCALLLLALSGLLITGCTSGDGPTTRPSDPTKDALSDPMGYRPTFDDDVSGGDMRHLDKKGLKGDADRFMNP
jgi:hypothetical protein